MKTTQAILANNEKMNAFIPEDLLSKEFYWIEELIQYRIEELCEGENELPPPGPPELAEGIHPYYDFLISKQVDFIERLALSLVFIAQTFPEFLERLSTKNQYTGQVFLEFGVRLAGDPVQVQPSWQTVFFLSFGKSKLIQLKFLPIIHSNHRMYKDKLLLMPSEKSTNPFYTPLILSQDLFNSWIYEPDLRNVPDENFPAEEINTELTWEDLFLNEETVKELEQLRLWLKHGDSLRLHSKLKKHISPGVRVLFYGPSGTGKTLTASLLGKEFQCPVYRIDLSQIVSKWIGETEKNIARIFDIAENKNWILFFDEADALFSKRGNVNNSNDRRANQEVSYLLQRVENYNGTIVMATNLKDNIDEAFMRRFQLIIHFPKPDLAARQSIWHNLLDNTFPFHEDMDLEEIAAQYELSGGIMKNAFRNLILKVVDREQQIIKQQDLHEAIQNEQQKNGIYTVFRKY